MIELEPGAIVRVLSPVLPPIQVAPPPPGAVVVFPVVGPQGPPGPVGGDVETVQEMIDDSLTAHIDAPEPHPAYDDLPSFRLLFENGLV